MQINGPGAHIDHMLRQTRMHHMQLSSMADMKANMLLTVASLVLGLSLSRLAHSPRDTVFIILVIASVLTIALAIYSTMPKAGPMPLAKGKPDVKSPAFTLLFFGDYSTLSYEEYAQEMETVMNDPSMTYEVQVRELYNLGRYLALHKFQMLRFAYLAFLLGIIASVLLACLRYF